MLLFLFLFKYCTWVEFWVAHFMSISISCFIYRTPLVTILACEFFLYTKHTVGLWHDALLWNYKFWLCIFLQVNAPVSTNPAIEQHVTNRRLLLLLIILCMWSGEADWRITAEPRVSVYQTVAEENQFYSEWRPPPLTCGVSASPLRTEVCSHSAEQSVTEKALVPADIVQLNKS